MTDLISHVFNALGRYAATIHSNPVADCTLIIRSQGTIALRHWRPEDEPRPYPANDSGVAEGSISLATYILGSAAAVLRSIEFDFVPSIMPTIVDHAEIQLTLVQLAAGVTGYAALPHLCVRGRCCRREEGHTLVALCALGLAFSLSGFQLAPSTGLFVWIVLLVAISLGLAVKVTRTTRQLHELRQHVEGLVQARTTHLQTTNEALVAEIAACQQSAAALAGEYTRLLEQAREIAAAEERARLARDLHDSVTQTLYSASLITQVLPAVWQRNPSEGERSLIKLRQLVRGALAEMRTLLFELRPAALDAANLGVLLQQLGDVLTGHTRIPVVVTIVGEAEPPTAVKIAIYRIAQEAFNNIAKHAGATQVDVTLRQAPGEVSLHVCDNGRGFAVTHAPGEHMGVRIMAERAAGIGAHFSIDSVFREGTVVSVLWPALEHSSTQVNQ